MQHLSRRALVLAILTFTLTAPLAVGHLSGAAAPGAVHVTPNGYRVPVFGMSIARDANGRLATECVQLSAPQVESARLSRSVSRSQFASAPRAVVQQEGGLTFEIVYTDAEGTGFLDPQAGPARKAAMSASLAAWSAVLQGTVPVVVQARMEVPEDPESTLLASAGPAEFYDVEGRLLPSSLASQVNRSRINPDRPDIEVIVNPTHDWDYAVNGAAAEGKASFVYTMIHEVGHGLGFLSSFEIETGAMLNAQPFPFDVFMNRGFQDQNPLTRRSTAQVLEDLTSGDLFFSGPLAVAASARSIVPLPMVKLYAPNPYEPGSSNSHVDQDTYADFKVGLMAPKDFGSGTDKIDILTLGILADMGYTLVEGAVTARLPKH